jgi:PPM family protein phosphatase
MVVPDVRAAGAVMRWQAAGLSDRGRRRPRNEDALLLLPESRIFAVADGMGGHAAGDIASRLAIAELAAAFTVPGAPVTDADALAERMTAAFASANRAVLGHGAEHPGDAGLGTTLTALAPLDSEPCCVIAHIGDSRAYLLRGGALMQLTRDHTWVQQQVDAGMLTPRQARSHPYSSVLLRVLGMPDVGRADIVALDVLPGDTLLLCTDGLSGMITDGDLRTMLARDLDVARHAHELVEAANLRGGVDNITGIVIRVEE